MAAAWRFPRMDVLYDSDPKLLKRIPIQCLTHGCRLHFALDHALGQKMLSTHAHKGEEGREGKEVKERADCGPGREDIHCLIEAKIGDCIFIAWETFNG